MLEADGTPLQSFNNGQPVQTQLYPNVHSGAPSFGSVSPPREVLRTPAIGDIDGDLEPEIVDSAGEHVYAWDADGTAVPGFPVRLDPALSLPRTARARTTSSAASPPRPCSATSTSDGAARDRDPGARPARLCVGRRRRRRCPASRRSCATRRSPAPRSSPRAALGDITGDGSPTSSRRPRSSTTTHPRPRRPAGGRRAASRNILTNILANVLGGSGRVYAVTATETCCPGWPTAPNGIVPDALPFVGPGVDHILGERRRRPGARGDRQRRDRRRRRRPTATARTPSHTTRSRRAASTSTSRR